MINFLRKVIKYWSLESRAKRVWDSRTDEEIINAYHDNRIWLNNLKFLNMDKDFSLFETTLMRYDKYIKPQMDKRKLWSKV